MTVPFTVVDGCGPWSTFVGGGAEAWEVTVQGQVLQATTGQPIPGAIIQIQGTSLTASTAADGRFAIANVPKGPQTLITTLRGYLTDTRPVQPGRVTLPLVVRLQQPVSVQLPTAAGTNVTVGPGTSVPELAGISVTFPIVMTPGDTTLERIDAPRGVPEPPGLTSAASYFSVTSTATNSGTADVVLPFDPTALGGADPSQLQVLRFENGVWVDRTVSVDFQARVVHASLPASSSAATAVAEENGIRLVGANVFVLFGNTGRAIFRDPAPVQDPPGSSPVLVFIPGISFGCGAPSFWGLLDVTAQVLCDATDLTDHAIPYSAVKRGCNTFQSILNSLANNAGYGSSPCVSIPVPPNRLQGGHVRFFSYSGNFASNGTYLPSDTRQALSISAALLGNQLEAWGLDHSYDIVAHSLGGAVATYWAATEQNPARLAAVHSITTLDSPVNGMSGLRVYADTWLRLATPVSGDLADPTRMRSSTARMNVVTLANDADVIVPGTAARLNGGCPAFLGNCTIFDLSLADGDHFAILRSQQARSQLTQLLAAAAVRGRATQGSSPPATVSGASVTFNDALVATTSTSGEFAFLIPAQACSGRLRVTQGSLSWSMDLSAASGAVTQITARLSESTSASTRIQRISMSADGCQGDGPSDTPTISADGRYIAFRSFAPNLSSTDISRAPDVFVKDRQTGAIEQLSTNGTHFNIFSGQATISADGRYVAFVSGAIPLPGDPDSFQDVFVKDRQTGVTERISTSSSGIQGNNNSGAPSISANGRYVTFVSEASNLVVGDTNGVLDVFVKDRQTGVTERISTSSSGIQGDGSSIRPVISADGRYTAFGSSASNLVPDDMNRSIDVFVKDRQTGVTQRVSTAADSTEGNDWSGGVFPASISADGRYIAFGSGASNLVNGDTNGSTDVFVKDRQTGAIVRISTTADGSQVNNDSDGPSISVDGRYVAFGSYAPGLAPGDMNGNQDIFVKDRETGAIDRISTSNDGTQGNSHSRPGVISADGRYVVFDSDASNLIPGDTNGDGDVFVVDRSVLLIP